MNYTELHLVPDYTKHVTRIVERVLERSNNDHVVIGPLVRPLPNDNRSSGHDYFIVAASEQKHGFRCDSIVAGGEGINGEPLRIQLIAAFKANKRLVIHDVNDELDMARLCEMLWPGERIRELRKVVEAERGPIEKPPVKAAFQ